MSLVELADEFERLISRDIESEMKDDSLSRRQRVALEDAEGALRMSKIGNLTESNVSFRHLAMLAQVKSDEEILDSIGANLSGKLQRMRTWINGPHFPEGLRIKVRNEPHTGLDLEISKNLKSSLSDCPWDSEGISEAITAGFRSNEISPKQGYRNLYLAILGTEKGPRLAPILAELDRNRVLSLLG